MKTPHELTRRELVEIVTALQQALYLDSDAQLTQVWNPDKEWDGAEVCDQLAEVLIRYQLAPNVITSVVDGTTQ